MGTLATECHNHIIMIPFQIIKWHTCSPNHTILAETVYLKIPYINVSLIVFGDITGSGRVLLASGI